MSIAYGLAVYFIFWWISLLLTLPFGVRNSSETGDALEAGQDRGAPVRPNMRRKMRMATALSAVFFLIFYANWHFGWLTLEKLPGPDKLY
jgi:predicted secreted protein